MKTINRLSKNINWELPKLYIINEYAIYLFQLFRGLRVKFRFRTSGKYVFIGKRCRFRSTNKIQLGNLVRIGNNCTIDGTSHKGILIGNKSKLGDNCTLKCSSFFNVGEGIKIGNNSSFDYGCYIGASGFVEVGDDVIAGRDIKFHAENHKFDNLSILIREQGVSKKGIKIGNNCWIGSNVIFLDGAIVGSGCVIAAGAIVSGVFPDSAIIGGCPARIIRMRSSKK